MRPELVLWAVRLGLPGWIVPNYFILVGLSSLLAFVVVLHWTRKDGADAYWDSRGLICIYLGALVGGYLVESLRMVPVAIAAGSLTPVLRAGRSAYGGMLTGLLCSTLYLRWHRQSIGAFLDRVSLGAGIVICFVRTGCFLAGCDYGLPTAFLLGLRFPPGSQAALDHSQRGWVPAGFPSLPVHPTQLYEAALGLLGSGVSFWLLRRYSRRNGSIILVFLAVYALGRFFIELLRGDATRGLYLGLSTAQYISLAMLAGCVLSWRGLRNDEQSKTRVAARP